MSKNEIQIWFKEKDRELFDESIPEAFERSIITEPLPYVYPEKYSLNCTMEEPGYMTELWKNFVFGRINPNVSIHIKNNSNYPDGLRFINYSKPPGGYKGTYLKLSDTCPHDFILRGFKTYERGGDDSVKETIERDHHFLLYKIKNNW